MRETRDHMGQKEMGCGIVGALFYRGGGGTTKAKKLPPILPPLPAIKTATQVKSYGNYGPMRRRSTSNELKCMETAKSTEHPSPKTGKQPSPKSTLVSPRPSSSSTSRLSLDSTPKKLNLSKESSQIINTRMQRKSVPNGTLYRSSSDNAMVIGHLGNINQTGNIKNSNYHLPQKKENYEEKLYGRRSLQMGNIYGGKMVNKMEPEVLRNMGNEKFKQGRFEEALSLYNEAISMDASKASYYSNRSAANISLNRLLEAVFDCRVAIRIEPSYHRAHHRLATLYLRLGEAEKAFRHFKCSGSKAETKNNKLQAQALKIQVDMCIDARKSRDWITLLKETHTTVHFGADSAPQIYAMQAEALLNLHRHEEAYSATQKGPKFDVNIFTQLFGSSITSNLLTIRAEVNMATGRFEEAMTAVQDAIDLDPSDEVKKLAKKVKAVSMARLKGNHLFKECKYLEACIAYSEGLEIEPYNSVLLCNRAACRYKLEQFEKAVEDCTASINLRPSYAKAMLRRASCNVKLERWETAIRDYEVLIQECLGNDEVEMALAEVRVQLKKQHIEDAKATKSVSNLVNITGKELAL